MLFKRVRAAHRPWGDVGRFNNFLVRALFDERARPKSLSTFEKRIQNSKACLGEEGRVEFARDGRSRRRRQPEIPLSKFNTSTERS